VPYLSALVKGDHDKALYKSTFTFILPDLTSLTVHLCFFVCRLFHMSRCSS